MSICGQVLYALAVVCLPFTFVIANLAAISYLFLTGGAVWLIALLALNASLAYVVAITVWNTVVVQTSN